MVQAGTALPPTAIPAHLLDELRPVDRSAGDQRLSGSGHERARLIHHTNLMSRTNDNREASGSRPTRAWLPGRGGGRGGANDEDHWSVFSTERREIATSSSPTHLRRLHSPWRFAHARADDGSNSDYATGLRRPHPVLCGAPLDQDRPSREVPTARASTVSGGRGRVRSPRRLRPRQPHRCHLQRPQQQERRKISLKFNTVPVRGPAPSHRRQATLRL